MERRRRIQAYGLCRDEGGRVALIPDLWTLPGDTIAHGEHPVATVTRAFAEHGLRVEVGEIRDVITDLDRDPAGQVLTHHDRLIFDVRALEGDLAGAVWVSPEKIATLPLAAYIVRALLPPLDGGLASGLAADAMIDPPVTGPPTPASNGGPVTPPSRHQRFAAYGLVTDHAGRVLLARIADRYPGAGRWHLPGGGTDFGETAPAGLLRELIEETNQRGRITGLLGVSHRHQRDAVGPERVAIDWHAVRVVFRALVDEPTPPRVMEGAGSTGDASWFSTAEALTLELTEVAHEAIANHDAQ